MLEGRSMECIERVCLLIGCISGMIGRVCRESVFVNGYVKREVDRVC